MTRYEAFEAIADINDNVSWIEYRDRILAILDQIDQPPGEFSVRELCELITATHDNYPDLHVELFGDGSWICGKLDDEGIEALRAKLIELAEPPEPTTVTAEIPLTTARYYAQFRHGDVAKACKAALEKAKL